jgi:hypothetical protein
MPSVSPFPRTFVLSCDKRVSSGRRRDFAWPVIWAHAPSNWARYMKVMSGEKMTTSFPSGEKQG